MTLQKFHDEPGAFRPRILLQEMPTGHQVRAFGMRQQPLELGAICARVEHVVLATPDQERRQRRRAQLGLEPAEPRKCTAMIVEPNPARPAPSPPPLRL